MERRLAAILAADLVGFAGLIEADEAGTLARLKACETDIIDPLIAGHAGRVVKRMGDGYLVEFASVVKALDCAAAWQAAMADGAAGLRFRIGVNLGDVMVRDGDIFGDGVNIAARLEALAVPGGICVSATVHDHAKGKVALAFEDLGTHQLKNIAKPLRVYRIVSSDVAASGQSEVLGQEAPKFELALSEKPSIAVLPFANGGKDPEQDYFSDGITEDIITELSRFRTLLVIARNSAFSFKGKTLPVQEIGRQLGVAYLVEGSVRRAGGRVRVTVQLVDADKGHHLWANRYDRDLEDIFAVQDEITESVAATIGGRLGAEERQRATRQRLAGSKAYDKVLRAQALYYQISRAENAAARPLLEDAIAADPDYARAHILLAGVHNMDYMHSWTTDPEASLALAVQHGQRALALDDADSLNHAQLGEVLQNAGRHVEAERHLEKALALNPNDVEARALYGAFLGGEAGLAQLDIASRLDPCGFVWIPWVRGSTLYDMGRYEEAVAALSQIDSRIVSARGWLAASLAQAGRLAEARAALEDFLMAAKADWLSFPAGPEQWLQFWRRQGQYDNDTDFTHLREGLRKAGLEF